MISILETVTRSVTEQKRLQDEGFNSSVWVSIINEPSSLDIDFDQYQNSYTIRVFDRALLKSVWLGFNYNNEGAVLVSVYFWKQKSKFAFWQKPGLKIAKSVSYGVEPSDENNDENVKFVWDRVPEFITNLR